MATAQLGLNGLSQPVPDLSQPGEVRTVYRSDSALVLCGRAEDALPTLNEKADLLIADPPYGVDWQSGRRKESFARIDGDDDAMWVTEVLRLALRSLRDKRHIYLFGPADLSDLPVGGVASLIWDKAIIGPGDLTCTWGPAHEPITFAAHVTRPSGRKAGDGRLAARLRRGSVLRHQRPNAGGVRRHPTEKPVDLLRALVESSSMLGETVLDPFAGSGSTGVAAIVEGRRCVLVEKDAHYAQLAADRVKAAEAVMAKVVGL